MNDKELVANAALDFVKNNTIIGLGTGSTANFFIEGLAKKIKEENFDIKVVASSTVSQIHANKAGLEYISMDQVTNIDLYVDGADEITTDLVVLKGRGYDLIKEKLLAKMSENFIVIGDKSKLVSRIGDNFPIPLEVSPTGWNITKNLIEKYSNSCVLRKNTTGDAFAITSYGNLVLDCSFEYEKIENLENLLSNTPGVFEHGIFYNIATKAMIADNGVISILN